METLNKVFTEEQVAEVSDKILKATLGKLTDELNHKFYNEMGNFIYEHYSNASDEIHRQLIKEITEEFVKEPKNYKFAELRKKLFNENKELLVKTLTDEAIEKSVEDVIQNYTHRDYNFHWQWKEAIVRIVLANWNTLKEDERIKNSFGREIDNLKRQIQRLQEQLQAVQTIVEED